MRNGFRTGSTQFGLRSHRRWPEACNIGFRKLRNRTIHVAKTNALISFAVTAYLICAFIFLSFVFSCGDSNGISNGTFVCIVIETLRPLNHLADKLR